MGQKTNPKAIRITGKVFKDVDTGGFANIWFSDFNYCSFFYQDFCLKKNQIRFIIKYYKSRVRFLKGRRRRLKSLLRISNFSCLHVPYKKYLLCCIHRPASIGLQRKHTAFIFQRRRNDRSKV